MLLSFKQGKDFYARERKAPTESRSIRAAPLRSKPVRITDSPWNVVAAAVTIAAIH
jgi:hypothetical protein